MARRYEHSQEEIRAMVMQAAKDIVVEQGAGALNVRKIAMKIGYTVGSIYMVFENMADLVLHLNADTLDEIEASLRQVEGEPAQCLEQMAKAYLAFVTRNFNRWSMLAGNRFLDDVQLPNWYRDKSNRLAEIIEMHIGRLLPQNTKQQNKRLSDALWGGIYGICLLSLNGNQDSRTTHDIEETLVVLVKTFVRV